MVCRCVFWTCLPVVAGLALGAALPRDALAGSAAGGARFIESYLGGALTGHLAEDLEGVPLLIEQTADLLETADAAGENWNGPFRLPQPFGYSTSFRNGQQRIDGLAITPGGRALSIEATGRYNQDVKGVQGDISLRFRF